MNSARRIELLRSTQFFRESSENLLEDLALGCEEVELEPAEVLFEQGDPGDALYVVDQGVLEIYLGDTVLDESGHGECLGEMALVTDDPRSASIRARETSSLLRLPREIFREVLARNPELAWGIIRELAAKVKSSIRVRVEQHRFTVRLEEAFARSVSRSVMEEILGSRNPVEFLEGSAKQATVLFADVHSFTSLSEQLEPGELMRVLNEYLSGMVKVILDNGGTVDKLVGDGILAHFGVPLPRRKDAWRAVRCAIQMQERLRELNQSGNFLLRHPLKIGIGLTTGTVIAGLVGSEQRMDYTAIGDVVTLAPRVESLTRIYGSDILLCDETARQIGSDLLLREVDRVRLKGRTHPTHIYDVLSLAEEANPTVVRIMLEYRSAFASYASGNFQEATRRFEELHRSYPDDGPTAALAERSKRYLSNPPSNWVCVFEPDIG